jgi:filamentous hemagglutinin
LEEIGVEAGKRALIQVLGKYLPKVLMGTEEGVLKSGIASKQDSVKISKDSDASGKASGNSGANVVANPGKTSAYTSAADDGSTRYVGITDNIEARSAAHMSQKGIEIAPIPGLQGISREDARAVEQVLIEYYRLGKDGGPLLNKINSIAASNPSYAASLIRGSELLKSIGYPGFK